MNDKKILGIPIENYSKEKILEKIINYLKNPKDFFHIVSLNPENLIIVQENKEFEKVLLTAQIKNIDGIGVAVASFLLNGEIPNRTSGVELMLELLKLANEGRLRVMLLGGGPKVAEIVIECQKEKFSKVKFFALSGIKNIKNPKKEEEEKIFSIVSTFKPQFLFAAFGSPSQELWLYKNREKFKGIVCMGVGGAFDYLARKVPRAPSVIRFLGFEWLFRLIIQPWRWRRQIRLIRFGWLILSLTIDRIVNNMRFISRKNFFELSKELMINITAGWLGLITAPFILGEFKNYSFILTRGLVLFILGVLISLWLVDQSKNL